MKKKLPYVLSVIILIAFIVFSVFNQPKKSVTKTYFYLGTVIDITLFEDNESLFREVSDLILKYDNMFNRNIQSSDIYRLNEKGTYEVSDETLYLIRQSIEYSDLSEGYFDITINPIVNLWQIGTEDAKVPSSSDINDELKKVSYENISIKGNEITLLNGATLDLGGIAKGYITDEIKRLLVEHSQEKALINLGGNVYALGTSSTNENWNIGIRHPELNRSDALLKVTLTDKSVVTSGIYERFFEENNVLYHHIFNPFTGYPIENNLLSLTVISDKSIDGDALSTALFNVGLAEAFIIAEEINVEIIVVTKDKRVIISNSLSDKIEIFDKTYTLEKNKSNLFALYLF